MGVMKEEVIEELKKYFSDRGFEDVNIESKHGRGKVIIGGQELLQTIHFSIKKTPLLPGWRVHLDSSYLEPISLDVIEVFKENGREVIYRPITDSGFFGEKSQNLKIVYKTLPSLRKLVWTEFLFGSLRGLMETSTNAKLFINLKDIGVLSVITDVALNTPGEWKGEQGGTQIVNEQIALYTPASKIKRLYEENCKFLVTRPWHTRVSLEEYLRRNYFKDPNNFEERYLSRYDDISDVIKKIKAPDEKAKEIAKILFDGKISLLEKDTLLYQYLKNISQIDSEDVNTSLRKFYGAISGASTDTPSPEKLWTRGKYVDIVNNLCDVVRHGYYEEMNDELRLLKDAEQTLSQIKSGKKLRRDDTPVLDQIVREYYAFLLTDQQHFDTQTNKEESEKRIALAKDFLEKISEVDSKIPAIMDNLFSYIGSRISAIRKAGVSEKKIYCSLAEAREKFLDNMVLQYRRELNVEEMKQVNRKCFEHIDKTRVGELASTTFLAGMITISSFYNTIPGGWLANAIGWGVPVGLKSLYESYCRSKGQRLMEYYLLIKYRRALEKEGADPESAFSELSSVLSRVYLSGYMTGTSIGMPFLYLTTPENSWPVLIPMGIAPLLLGITYKRWLEFEKKAKLENGPNVTY